METMTTTTQALPDRRRRPDRRVAREAATRGPRSYFVPKQPPNRSHSMTELAKDVLAAASERLSVSESDLVEYAVRTTTWGPGGEAEQFFAAAKST
jgi:hypothetical protein